MISLVIGIPLSVSASKRVRHSLCNLEPFVVRREGGDETLSQKNSDPGLDSGRSIGGHAIYYTSRGVSRDIDNGRARLCPSRHRHSARTEARPPKMLKSAHVRYKFRDLSFCADP